MLGDLVDRVRFRVGRRPEIQGCALSFSKYWDGHVRRLYVVYLEVL